MAVNGAWQTASFSCLSRRRVGGLRVAVRGRCYGSSFRRFRKARFRRGSSQALGSAPLTTDPRTCFEGPFGEVIRATGPMAKANPFRFSTKYQDDETDLLCYGFRYYNASTGRWIGRDPAEEDGEMNLYALVGAT